MKNVVLLGPTGSIGTNTVKVAEDLPDRIRLVGLAAGNNAGLLLKQQFGVVAGGQADQPDAVRQIIGHLDGAGADGAGRTE